MMRMIRAAAVGAATVGLLLLAGLPAAASTGPTPGGKVTTTSSALTGLLLHKGQVTGLTTSTTKALPTPYAALVGCSKVTMARTGDGAAAAVLAQVIKSKQGTAQQARLTQVGELLVATRSREAAIAQREIVRGVLLRCGTFTQSGQAVSISLHKAPKGVRGGFAVETALGGTTVERDVVFQHGRYLALVNSLQISASSTGSGSTSTQVTAIPKPLITQGARAASGNLHNAV